MIVSVLAPHAMQDGDEPTRLRTVPIPIPVPTAGPPALPTWYGRRWRAGYRSSAPAVWATSCGMITTGQWACRTEPAATLPRNSSASGP